MKAQRSCFWELKDRDGAEPYFINQKTGERQEADIAYLRSGSVIYTPEEVERHRRYKEMLKEREEREKAAKQTREYNSRQSFYYALSRDRRADGLKPQTLARLFFAATFLRYDDDRLYLQDGSLMDKDGLAKLMRLGSSTFKSLWTEVDGKYIFTLDDSSLKMTGEFFRGSLTRRIKLDKQKNEYQQIFVSTLRELYWQIEPKKHRYLGYMLMILNKVSWEYNILCKNPDETDRSKIETMDLDDFCRSMGSTGHTENQRQRLLDAFRKLRFSINNTEQFFCAYLEDHVSGRYYLVVNPNVIYSGSDRSKVDGFGTFFPNLLDTIRPKSSGKNAVTAEDIRGL